MLYKIIKEKLKVINKKVCLYKLSYWLIYNAKQKVRNLCTILNSAVAVEFFFAVDVGPFLLKN